MNAKSNDSGFIHFFVFILILCVQIFLIIYAFSLEPVRDDGGRSYWSSDLSIAIWLGLVPGLMLFTAILTRSAGRLILSTIILIFTTHLSQMFGMAFLVMPSTETFPGVIFKSDDVVGLFLLVTGANLAAFYLGTLLRHLIKKEFRAAEQKGDL